jgi:hypothetical protein
MSHFAQVIDNIVVQVIVAEQDFIDHIKTIEPGEWIQTSYNTRGGIHYDPTTGKPSADQSKALRKNYAGIGFVYNKELDAFVPPKPKYESWVLNKSTGLWEAPIPEPKDGKNYSWDENKQVWVLQG